MFLKLLLLRHVPSLSVPVQEHCWSHQEESAIQEPNPGLCRPVVGRAQRGDKLRERNDLHWCSLS